MKTRIDFTYSEFMKMMSKEKEFGHGSDGKVYTFGKKYLIKFYRKSIKKLNDLTKEDVPIENNDEDMKIYVLKKHRNPNDNTNYHDQPRYEFWREINYYKADSDDETKLEPELGIMYAINRQKKIKATDLPKAAVYVDNKFIGCIIKRINGIGIHKLFFLPLLIKKKIILTVIDEMEELFNNYVYHKDLSNNPFSNLRYIDENGDVITEKGHSHVLVIPLTLQPNIIDLDGKSTTYTEKESTDLKKDALGELLVLIIEYLLCIEMDNDKEVSYIDDDNPYIKSIIEKYDAQIETIFEDLDNQINSLDDMRELVKSIQIKK